jgi:HK97 family phage prohead protease
VTQTAYGILATELGHARSRTSTWSTPSSQIRTVQDPQLRIDVEHSGLPIGEAIFLERDRGGRVWLVAHIDDFTPVIGVRVGAELRHLETPYYWSIARIGDPDYGYLLTSVALTASPARVGARSWGEEVAFLPGQLDHRSAADRWRSSLKSFEHEMLTRATQFHLDRRRNGGGPLVVHGQAPRISDHAQLELAARTAGPIEVRSAELAGVTGRTIELIVAPAESPAIVLHNGNPIEEVFSHGAFAGCEQHPERVRVNRDHKFERTVGVATHLDPWAEQGLVGTIKLARTDLADESLELARDGCLDASAGFRIAAEKWQGRKLRRVTKALLHHVALTPDPAYEAARVLAVRASR